MTTTINLTKEKLETLFTVDTNHGETFLDTASINFTWFGNDTLQIEYDKKLQKYFFKKRKLTML